MIKGKIVIRGTIVLLTPAIIGSGKNENTDIDLLRDSLGRPYIPATSLAGVLRSCTKKMGYKDSDISLFWGSEHSDNIDSRRMNESLIKVYDLNVKSGCDYSTNVRDGVRIDNKTGIALNHAKYDYEIIEPETKFDLCLEISLKGDEEQIVRDILSGLLYLLKAEKVKIGAKTNSGFGEMKLEDFSWYEFDFSKKEDVIRWLKRDFSKEKDVELKPVRTGNKTFTIKGYFRIKNSLIVRSYNIDENSPDSSHIKSRDKDVLPGTSSKGAIRSRAERIVNTLSKDMSIIDELFGYVRENKKGEARRGRITVSETLLEGYPREIQTRIKIDRFTGGTIEGALMETMPLFSNNDSKEFCIEINIEDYKDYEAGLMLLVLKDLYTGDLAIGGEKAIGRGVLVGKRAEIEYDGDKIEIEDIDKIEKSKLEKLERFVSAFVNL